MAQTAVTQVVKTLNDVHQRFGLRRSPDEQFFTEWHTNLPSLDASEQATLDQIRQRFRYHREAGQVAEGAVNAIVVSRLLEMTGFYDPPFRLRSEVSVEIETTSDHETLRGRIDFLVIQEQFWRSVIESKDTEFDIEVGIPQTLAYMMANSTPNQPLFGMVTNGNSFIFLKVKPGESPEYDFSEVYTLLARSNHLYEVLQILKGIAQGMVQHKAFSG
ncbi:type I restriction endonuclease subunit R [filamentous cyanobacterium CCP1]|nr:type I restriction endonuclease subunit R [filamentous cyanobacterium CCP2]PSB67596.1 type I restriction endonuclease subunit R [filamentous cyanobacterium CCP1]